GPSSAGFEAAVIFAAVPLLHTPAVALFAVLTLRRSLLDTLQLASSYAVVALLYCSAVAADAPAMAQVSGYVLLVVGYLAANLAFRAARRLEVRDNLIAQVKLLLLVTPIVAVEVMSYRAYGLAGFTIAFLPVLLLAYALRNVADAARQNSELSRRNRELSILTESASQILSAEGDEETLRRMMTLLGRLARLKACAAVRWETNPDAPARVYRFGACLPSDGDVLRWVELA